MGGVFLSLSSLSFSKKDRKEKYQKKRKKYNNIYLYILYILRKKDFILLIMEDNIKIDNRGVGEEGREEEEAEKERKGEKERRRDIVNLFLLSFRFST